MPGAPKPGKTECFAGLLVTQVAVWMVGAGPATHAGRGDRLLFAVVLAGAVQLVAQGAHTDAQEFRRLRAVIVGS